MNNILVQPKKVIEKYSNLIAEKKYEEAYYLLSSRSKTTVTEDEFVKAHTNDSASIISNHIIAIDCATPMYKRFKWEGEQVQNGLKSKFRDYFTLINENDNWKIIWTSNLENQANEDYDKGFYNETIKIGSIKHFQSAAF